MLKIVKEVVKNSTKHKIWWAVMNILVIFLRDGHEDFWCAVSVNNELKATSFDLCDQSNEDCFPTNPRSKSIINWPKDEKIIHLILFA